MSLVVFIHSVTLWLLIGAFGPFTFKVIIDRYVFIAILLLVLLFLMEISSDPFLPLSLLAFVLKESPLIFIAGLV